MKGNVCLHLNELHLHYERSDDRDRRVYGIYLDEDRLSRRFRLGEVRLLPADFDILNKGEGDDEVRI